MDENNRINKFLSEYNKSVIQAFTERVKPLSDAAKAISVNIPKFPKIEFPKIEIAYERIESIIEHNSSYGWTMTGEMNTLVYMDGRLIELNGEQIDSIFVNYYGEYSKENYYITKDILLGEINDQWKEVLTDCFDLYEEGKYKVIIPMLISIVESEVSFITQSDAYGRGLLNEWGSKILNEKQKLTLIISRSIHNYLKDSLFGFKNFNSDRGSYLNRNWVLHGRDDPNLWKKSDALKLINLLSSLQFIKD